jgi:hypothetical protein
MPARTTERMPREEWESGLFYRLTSCVDIPNSVETYQKPTILLLRALAFFYPKLLHLFLFRYCQNPTPFLLRYCQNPTPSQFAASCFSTKEPSPTARESAICLPFLSDPQLMRPPWNMVCGGTQKGGNREEVKIAA